MKCPVCGGKVNTSSTFNDQADGVTVRMKYCSNEDCPLKAKTYETIDLTSDEIQDLKNIYNKKIEN